MITSAIWYYPTIEEAEQIIDLFKKKLEKEIAEQTKCVEYNYYE